MFQKAKEQKIEFLAMGIDTSSQSAQIHLVSSKKQSNNRRLEEASNFSIFQLYKIL
jgi:hypothetical protein